MLNSTSLGVAGSPLLDLTAVTGRLSIACALVNAAAPACAVDGWGAARLVRADGQGAITLVGLELRNGAAQEGGAVAQTGGEVVADDDVFDGNRATSDGGAVADQGGSFSAANTTFLGNTAVTVSGVRGALTRLSSRCLCAAPHLLACGLPDAAGAVFFSFISFFRAAALWWSSEGPPCRSPAGTFSSTTAPNMCAQRRRRPAPRAAVGALSPHKRPAGRRFGQLWRPDGRKRCPLRVRLRHGALFASAPHAAGGCRP